MSSRWWDPEGCNEHQSRCQQIMFHHWLIDCALHKKARAPYRFIICFFGWVYQKRLGRCLSTLSYFSRLYRILVERVCVFGSNYMCTHVHSVIPTYSTYLPSNFAVGICSLCVYIHLYIYIGFPLTHLACSLPIPTDHCFFASALVCWFHCNYSG